MKRILTLAALAAITLAASAQDLQKATELAKQANEALMNSDFKTAIDNNDNNHNNDYNRSRSDR